MAGARGAAGGGGTEGADGRDGADARLPWARELAGRLASSPHPIVPVYVILHRTPPMPLGARVRSARPPGLLRRTPLKQVSRAATCSVVHFADGWLLRGWRRDDASIAAVDVLLSVDGEVRSLDGLEPTSHFLDVVDARGRFGEIEGAAAHGWQVKPGTPVSPAPEPTFVHVEGVEPLHRHGFVTVTGTPLAAGYDETAKRGNDLYQEVAVPVLAALSTTPPPDDHWIVGVTPS